MLAVLNFFLDDHGMGTMVCNTSILLLKTAICFPSTFSISKYFFPND